MVKHWPAAKTHVTLQSANLYLDNKRLHASLVKILILTEHGVYSLGTPPPGFCIYMYVTKR